MTREPTRNLIGGAVGLLALAEDAYQLAMDRPGDAFPILACFLFANSLRDWAGAEGLAVDASRSPYRQTIREVANGTKHLCLDTRSHPNPHVGDVQPAKAFGQGAYGKGLYGGPVSLMAQRDAAASIELTAATRILRETLDWWAAALTPS